MGICFGHQIIAKALGGTVEKFDRVWAIEHNTYNIGRKVFDLNAWHQDQVSKLPEGTERVGTSEFCENAMLYYEGQALTIQPHPEFNSLAIGAFLLLRAKGVVPDDLQDIARQRLLLPDSNQATGNRLAHFFNTKSLS